MAEISRRVVVASAAGFVLVSPAQATASLDHPALRRLALAIEAEIGGLRADPVRVMGRIQDHLRASVDAGIFEAWRDLDFTQADKVTVLGGGAGAGWKVQLFRIPEGRSHPPHCHENLASCLVVVDGRLRLREYERLRDRETERATTLRRVSDAELAAGQAIVTAEDYRNAHWFGAVGGPALAANFKASGHFRREFLRLRNRRYLDPSAEGDGPFQAPFITAREARARFATKAF